MKPVSPAVGLRRLERLAKILDTADAEHRKRGESTYDQRRYLHDCGTPACALGHYAAATPKRWICEIGRSLSLRTTDIGVSMNDVSAREFAITPGEVNELFAWWGCDGAQTAKQAARYIRDFVARKRKELIAKPRRVEMRRDA